MMMQINNINGTYTVFLMDEKKDLYNVDNYSDEDLYEMLDMNHPSDRELETKILLTIDKYDEIKGDEAKKIKQFFEKVYDRFFDPEEEEENNEESVIEGMQSKEGEEKARQTDYNNALGEAVQTDRSESDRDLVQTTTLTYSASQLNPILKETQKRILQLDSQFRNYSNYPSPTNYLINLSERLHNVVSMRLHSVSIPYTWYNVSNVYNANYFSLKGNVDGIKGVYDLKFDISAGAYNTMQLIDAVNQSITSVASGNTDIDFGTTGITYDEETSKVTLTLDIQQVYNETNFYLYFNYLTSTFESDASRCKSIPSFMGYANMVIPKYLNTNFVQSQSITSVPNAYSLESIYSNYQYSLNATGKICPANNITYNAFDPNISFYLAINNDGYDDSANVVIGNNYFDIISFDGPNPYSTAADTSSNVIEKFRVTFGDVSGLYSRGTLLGQINGALLSNQFLSSNASLNQYDISYALLDGSYNTLQRYQLRTRLNRETSVKKKNSKQIIVFPDETNVVNNLDQSTRNQYWQGPIWTGINSCFMFDESDKFLQPNAIRAEVSPINTYYDVSTNPTLTLECTKTGYSNNYNNRRIEISKSSDAGYNNGYLLNDLIGVYGYGDTYESSEINTKLNNIRDLDDNTINNGFVKSRSFYDIGSRSCRMQFDILTYFDETDYSFDLTNSFFYATGSGITPLGVADASYAWRANVNVGSGYTDGTTNDQAFGGSATTINVPSGTLQIGTVSYENTPKNLIVGSFTWNYTNGFVVNGNNDRIVVSPTSNGISTLSPYTIYFKHGTYRTPELFENMINATFSKIQGITDASGTALNGLRMVNSALDFTSNNNWNLKIQVDNRLTAGDYKVVFADSGTSYSNEWIDTNGNVRYYLNTDPETIESSGNVLQNTSTGNAITGTLWDAYLGFTNAEYNLGSDISSNVIEIVSSRDVMFDVSKVMQVYEENVEKIDVSSNTVIERKNNILTFTPQTNVKGLIDANGVKKIEIELAGGLYPLYYLYNEINTKLNIADSQSENSVIYSFFDSEGLETTVIQTNINKVYTAQDYLLEFYNAEEAATQNIKNVTNDSFAAITYDVTLGWQLGFRAAPEVNLSITDVSNNYYSTNYSYSLDTSTNIITMLGNTTLDLYLYKNLYLILNDFTQNHLNDGLVTGVRDNPLASRPKYSSNATKVCNPETNRNQASIFNATEPGMGLTENQLYAANAISEDNYVRQTTRVFSDPPYVKDMFGLIPIKVSSLSQGQVFTEFGGMLQDNRRDYFGPVNVEKLEIKLLNDHGDVVDLNGANWSFSIIFEYLYNLKGI